jgi:hypothetical protein
MEVSPKHQQGDMIQAQHWVAVPPIAHHSQQARDYMVIWPLSHAWLDRIARVCYAPCTLELLGLERECTVSCQSCHRSYPACYMKAHLIVIGTHGRTGLEHLFLGSVAEKVVRLAACPVLVTR